MNESAQLIKTKADESLQPLKIAIRGARKAKGLSQKAMGEMVGVSGSTYGRWERTMDFPMAKLDEVLEILEASFVMEWVMPKYDDFSPIESFCARCDRAGCRPVRELTSPERMGRKNGLTIVVKDGIPEDCPYAAEHAVSREATVED